MYEKVTIEERQRGCDSILGFVKLLQLWRFKNSIPVKGSKWEGKIRKKYNTLIFQLFYSKESR
jgi:hypothetical protein